MAEKLEYSDDEYREQWVYRWAGEDDAAVLQRDQTLSFAQANSWPAYLAIKTATGSLVEDFSGRTYIDLHGNNCHHIGHQHPDLITVLQTQMQNLGFNSRGFTNIAFVELAELVASLWPRNDPGLFLVPGGSAAVELAMMLVRVHTGRYKTLSFVDSFHGRSLGAIGLSASPLERPDRLGPLLPGAIHVPSYKAAIDDTAEFAAKKSYDAIREALQQYGDIACLIAEPIANGGFLPPQWYWPEVRHICDRHECLLIFDEIPLGLGKTGWLFNGEGVGVVPDITVLGKALGGAILPVAAVIADRRLDTAAELNLGYFTHEKNPLMARAASETIAIIQRENLVERAQQLGFEIGERLTALGRQYPETICATQGLGMIHGIHLKKESDARRVFFRAIQNGLILNYPGYGLEIKLSFALNIETSLIDQAFTKLNCALSG